MSIATPEVGPPIHFAGRTLDPSCHVCAFFNSAEEEDGVMLPFVKEGIDRGEKAFHIVDPGQHDQYVARQQRGGIDMTTTVATGQFELRSWHDAYLREGRFDQDAMLALIEDVLRKGREEGYPLTRLVAHMEWSLEDRPGVNDLVEYESRLNYILPNYRDPVICTYDTAKFSGGVLMDILRTHPMVVVGGILRENPFYVPPDEFLQELRDREARAAAKQPHPA